MTDSVNQSTMPLLPPSPGALIKIAREQAGVHIAVMAVNVKVSVKQLEALEADDFDKLSGIVFARALAAKVCRLLKIDSEPILAMMPAATNGLKPLNIIGSENNQNAQHYQTDHRRKAGGSHYFLGLLVLISCASAWVFYGKEIGSYFSKAPEPATFELMPVLPPVQEVPMPEPTPAPEAPQTASAPLPLGQTPNSPTLQPSAHLGVSAPIIVTPESKK